MRRSRERTATIRTRNSSKTFYLARRTRSRLRLVAVPDAEIIPMLFLKLRRKDVRVCDVCKNARQTFSYVGEIDFSATRSYRSNFIYVENFTSTH